MGVPSVALATVPNGGELDTIQLGKIFVQSGYFADARDASQAIVKVLAGRELGFPPIASMTGIYIVKGKVSLSANLIAAAIKRSGRYTYKVLTLGDDKCSVQFFERNGDKWEPIGTSEFSRQDAQRAGTQNMDRFPRNMLFARAMSNGAKWFCPDIFGGPVYTPEELGAPVNEDGEVIDSTATIPARVLAATEPAAQPTPPPADSGIGNGWHDVESAPQAGKTNGTNGTPQGDGPKMATEKQIGMMGALVKEMYPKAEDMDGFRDWLKKSYGVTSRKELTLKQASEVIDMLQKMKNGEQVPA